MQPPQTEADPREQLIRQVFAADRGKRPDDATLAAYLLALKRMDTARLARVVEKLLAAIETDPDQYRVPSPSAMWRVAKELRTGAMPPARPVLELEPTHEHELDGWDKNANLLLLAYVTKGLVEKSVYGVRAPGRDANRYAPDARMVCEGRLKLSTGPQTIDRTAILVKWKNAWARDMREDREMHGGKLDGKRSWLDCMAAAEREIDSLNSAEQRAA